MHKSDGGLAERVPCEQAKLAMLSNVGSADDVMQSESWASSPAVRRSMRANRRVDTNPERRLRSELHARGMRFRKDLRVDLEALRVRVDVAFPKVKLAVFVDGCFWHCCPVHGTQPRANESFWSAKLQRNVERDHQVDEALSEAGWSVLRVWEHESLGEAAERIGRVVASSRKAV